MEQAKKTDLQEKDTEQVTLEPKDLGQVAGGTDPFADTPRVPDNPIDDDLRKDG